MNGTVTSCRTAKVKSNQATGDGATRVRLAYLVNQYPSPSLVFVRREIMALERAGTPVARLAIRRWPGELIDPEDVREAKKTSYLLEHGIWRLLVATVIVACTRPLRFGRGLRLAWRVGQRSDRGRFRNLMYFVEACLAMRLLRLANIEWVHAHFGTNSTTVAMLCHEIGGPPYSFTVHGPEEFDRPEALSLSDKIERARLVFGVSYFGVSQLCRWCHHRHWSKLKVVRCGVDPTYLKQVPTEPPTAPRLVSVGRLHEQKGTLLLLDAAHRLVASGEPLELILIGDGPMRGEVEQRISELGLSDRVKLLGWQTGAEIQAWLARSRALVLPSFAEGLPVVIMESLAMYRPVITTYIAGIPELVSNGDCGWLVPSGDVRSLVHAMEEAVHASEDKLAALGAEGAARVRRDHNIDRQVSLIVQLIGEQLARR
ncbi:MAG: glycosyltransferase [Planctomycetales bacterium]|nr:glycosyltransferase [Planctomycetales bacterium]